MPATKPQAEYTVVPPDFTPGPKNGHLSTLDPEFAQVKPTIDALVDDWWQEKYDLHAFRKFWEGNQATPPGCPVEGEDVITEIRKVKVRDGAEIEVKIYTAKEKKGDKPGALVVRTHGGGWVVGGHNTEHSESLIFAEKLGAVVVSVDYRMAPEYRFPYAINDAFDALKWAKENASSLGADPEKIVVIGSSAGAGLTAALPIMAREEGVTGIVGQILSFPSVCHPKFFPTNKFELKSYQQNFNVSVVDPVRMEWFLDHYMPEPTDDWRASPLLAESLANLPPALVMVAGYDILRDEGIAYAERLQSEGVETQLEAYQGMPHCFYMFAEHKHTKSYYDNMIAFMEKYAS